MIVDRKALDRAHHLVLALSQRQLEALQTFLQRGPPLSKELNAAECLIELALRRRREIVESM